MGGYDGRLEELRRQMTEKEHLESVLTEMESRQAELEKKVWNLGYDAQKERSDVERLEGRSLAALVYGLLGRREEKLDAERAEAAAAVLKHEAAQKELEQLEEQIAPIRTRLSDLRDCEAEYARQLRQKGDAIEAGHSAEAFGIARLREEIASLNERERELNEAVLAGREAVSTADGVLECLDRAAKWSTADAFGIDLADLPKYAALEDAHACTLQLQIQLDAFRSELADVELETGLQVELEGLLKFADFFFDGLLADLAVRDRIDRARASVGRARERIGMLMERLESEIGESQKARADRLARIEKIILETKVNG